MTKHGDRHFKSTGTCETVRNMCYSAVRFPYHFWPSSTVTHNQLATMPNKPALESIEQECSTWGSENK
eukprot:3230798-Amphidinium_carterae.1